jgi:hypothetical protein
MQDASHSPNNNKATVALFLDTEKGFHKVWITGLIAQLTEAKISPHLIHVIHIYPQNLSFSITHVSCPSGQSTRAHNF